MRRIAPPALAVLTLLAVAPGGAAAAVRETVRATGELAVTWRGDPVRGCAEQGVCDVRGSVVFTVRGGRASSVASGRRLRPLRALGIPLGGGTIRVARGDPAAPLGVCRDRSTASVLGLQRVPGGFGRVRFAPGEGPATLDLDAGRCAGPLASDLVGALPQATLRRSATLGRRIPVDLRGRRPFVSGPYAGEVVSSLRATVRRRVTRGRAGAVARVEPTARRRAGRGRRIAVLDVRYAVEVVGGALGARVSAVGAPACRLFDACGLLGRVDLRPGPTAGVRLDVRATAAATAVRGRGARAGLTALGAGRLRLAGTLDGFPLGGRVAATLDRDGAPACRDERDVVLPALVLEGRGRVARLALGSRAFAEQEDPLRTRCAGPVRRGDVGAPAGTLAAGVVRVDALARGEASADLRLVPSAATWPFALAPDAALTVRLRRISARLRFTREAASCRRAAARPRCSPV